MRLTIVRIVALALTLVLAASCGGDEVVSSDDPRPTQTSSASGAEGTRYTATGTVLESPEHGPQLCSGVDDSYPPQCGGPDVIGWDWDDVPGKESASGTTWGTYTVVGTWDGEALTLTEPPTEPQGQQAPDDPDRFATPCPEPEGGWRVLDPASATDEAMQAAIEHARAQPDAGGVWLDQSINPAARQEPIDEAAMNDPTRMVLNVTFTGDLERHEAELRERWGGPLCVSEAPASMADLEAIREEVQAEVGGRMTSSAVDEVRGRIEIGVHIDDEDFQGRFDERYGEGVVVVGATLRPVVG